MIQRARTEWSLVQCIYAEFVLYNYVATEGDSYLDKDTDGDGILDIDESVGGAGSSGK